MTATDLRPEPDALLAQAKREGRGRLKIFLGAAPGVGKTFAMLEAARRLRADGVDVVAAVVETHGRAETEALLQGLDLGADDYMVKPFEITEFEARVRSLLRRQAGLRAAEVTIGERYADLRAAGRLIKCTRASSRNWKYRTLFTWP